MSIRNSIKGIPSHQKLSEDIQALEAISALWPFLRLLRVVKGDLSEHRDKIKELRAHCDDLVTLPDRFNDAFAARGWVAYESLKLEVMRRATEHAEADRLDDGEQELLQYYRSEENLRFHLRTMKALKAWQPRVQLAEKAKEDYLEARYHASVPVVLALMDGLVSDVATTGFFAQGTEMEAWDSIAGHSTGLRVICEIFNKGRRRTTTEAIEIPYRHGIMHGRDLGYDNEIVATKCWAALFAIREWALKFNVDPAVVEAKTKKRESFSESLRSLAALGSRLKENDEVKQQLAAWKPREPLGPIDSIDSLEDGSPESVAAIVLQSWHRGNYGAIAKHLSSLSGDERVSKRAGRIRSQIEPRRVEEFDIIGVKDLAPAITVVVARVVGQRSFAVEPEELFFGLRVINEDDAGRAVVRGRPEGTWRMIETSLYTPEKRAESFLGQDDA